MSRAPWTGIVVAGLFALALTSVLRGPAARAQKAPEEVQWEYKVVVASYNPGERLTDAQRAKAYEKTLNEQARIGWEPVGSILSRDMVQTVGGAITTRDTISFFTYRRPKR